MQTVTSEMLQKPSAARIYPLNRLEKRSFWARVALFIVDGSVASVAAIFAMALAALLPAGEAAAQTACTPSAGFTDCQRYSYTGADQTFIVPAGVTSVQARLWGAAGGGANSTFYQAQGGGGGGGYSLGTIAVTPGQTLTLTVGQGGIMNSVASTYGGGGAGGASSAAIRQGASGGGMSAIWSGASKTAAATRLVAGGGGGASPGADVPSPFAGGGGGTSGGQDGVPTQSGRGGTQTAGGAAATGTSSCTLTPTPGTQFQGGRGARATNLSSFEGGGGGGGGWFGGGGGLCQNAATQNGAGGGGSSYIAGTGVTGASTTAGQNFPYAGGNCAGSAASGGASDPFYVTGLGVGPCYGNGGNGQIVIQWARPTVTITKISNGGVGAFTFTGGNGWTSQTITTVTAGVGETGATQILAAAATATTITESTIPTAFTLTSITCTGLGAGGVYTPDIGARSVTFDAAATAVGANIACTFTNSAADMSIDLSGMPDGAAGNQFYNGTFTCTNVGSVIALNATCSISGLPAGLGTSCSPTPPVFVGPGNAITCTVFGYPVITSPGTITLTGTTGATNDGNPTNNTATLLLNVVPTVAFIERFGAGPASDGKSVVVSWSTKAERGTAGFRLERYDTGAESWRRLGAALLPGLVVAPHGGDYQLVDLEARAGQTYRYRLIEHDLRGVEHVYGPWTLATTGAAAQIQAKAAAWPGETVGPWKAIKPGYSARPHLPAKPSNASSPLIGAQSASARPATLQSAARQAPAPQAASAATVAGVNFRTTVEGMHVLDATALNQSASLLGLTSDALRTGLGAGQLRLESGGDSQPYYYDSTTDSLIFVGAAYRNRETDSNVYRLRKAAGRVMPAVSGAGPQAGSVGLFRATGRFKQRNTDSSLGYLAFPWIHNEPDAEYWFWDYVYAPYKPSATLNIALTDPAAQGQGVIRVHLRGASNELPGMDHRASIKLNGAPLSGSVEWDGATAAVLEASFDQTTLGPVGPDGAIDVQIEVDGGVLAGSDYSYFLIDRVDVDYNRLMRARHGGVWLRQLPGGVNAVDGLAGAGAIRVIENPGSAQARLRRDITVSAGVLGRKVSFVADAGADYLVSDAPVVPTPEADYASALKTTAHKGRYLIVAPRAFSGAAQALAAQRATAFPGAVEIAWLDDVYDEFSFGRVNAKAIGDFLGYALGNWRAPPRFVVLLGRGTVDHRDLLGFHESFIPVQMAPTRWGLAMSDNRYADVNGDHIPDLSLGRIAVSSAASAQAYVDKLIAYEAAAPGLWSQRAALVADNPDAGGNFVANSNGIASVINRYGGYAISKLYQSATPGAPGVRAALVGGWPAGYGYVNYDGHGSYAQFGDSTENYLRSSDVPALGNGASLPLVAAMSCAVGDSSNPGVLSLMDSLVLQPGGGAIASFAASGLSVSVHANRLNHFFVISLFGARSTIGAAAVYASRNAATGARAIDPFMHDIYVVSGDPAARLR